MLKATRLEYNSVEAEVIGCLRARRAVYANYNKDDTVKECMTTEKRKYCNKPSCMRKGRRKADADPEANRAT